MNTQTAMTVSSYMRAPEQLARFTDLLGKDAQAYVQSVLITVASDDKLQACTPQSIFKSALRAASLGLSCDPALKQAWIVSYNKNIGTKENPKWIKEAQFQPHYKGLYTLAMRTGKYWTINVSPVYEGQRVLENPLTGLHVVQESTGFIGEPKSYNAAYVDVTQRRKKDLKVIGWIGYSKSKRGMEKSVWMSCAEIEDHARQYVRGYEKNENWSDPDKRPTMEMKTVLRQLLSWADLSGSENTKLVEALRADQADIEEPIDAQSQDVPSLESAEQHQDVIASAEMIDPLGKQPVGYAANQWNIPANKARKDIEKAMESGKLKNPMPKEEFKKFVANPQGEPEAV